MWNNAITPQEASSSVPFTEPPSTPPTTPAKPIPTRAPVSPGVATSLESYKSMMSVWQEYAQPVKSERHLLRTPDQALPVAAISGHFNANLEMSCRLAESLSKGQGLRDPIDTAKQVIQYAKLALKSHRAMIEANNHYENNLGHDPDNIRLTQETQVLYMTKMAPCLKPNALAPVPAFRAGLNHIDPEILRARVIQGIETFSQHCTQALSPAIEKDLDKLSRLDLDSNRPEQAIEHYQTLMALMSQIRFDAYPWARLV